jgi:hypothetical protein
MREGMRRAGLNIMLTTLFVMTMAIMTHRRMSDTGQVMCWVFFFGGSVLHQLGGDQDSSEPSAKGAQHGDGL